MRRAPDVPSATRPSRYRQRSRQTEPIARATTSFGPNSKNPARWCHIPASSLRAHRGERSPAGRSPAAGARSTTLRLRPGFPHPPRSARSASSREECGSIPRRWAEPEVLAAPAAMEGKPVAEYSETTRTVGTAASRTPLEEDRLGCRRYQIVKLTPRRGLPPARRGPPRPRRRRWPRRGRRPAPCRAGPRRPARPAPRRQA